MTIGTLLAIIGAAWLAYSITRLLVWLDRGRQD